MPTGNNPTQPPPGPLLNATLNGPAIAPVVCPGVSVGPTTTLSVCALEVPPPRPPTAGVCTVTLYVVPALLTSAALN